MEEAVEWVKRCPNPMESESEIEIRPLFGMEDFGDAMTPELREQERGCAPRPRVDKRGGGARAYLLPQRGPVGSPGRTAPPFIRTACPAPASLACR